MCGECGFSVLWEEKEGILSLQENLGGSRRSWALTGEGFVCFEGGMQKKSIKLQQIKTYVSFQSTECLHWCSN